MLTKFHRAGARMVYGPEYTNWVYGFHANIRNRRLVNQVNIRNPEFRFSIGMMSQMIENFGEDAVFCIPLCGE